MRAKDLATTAWTPAALRQAAACSRDEPQPKFLPATMTSPGRAAAANPGSRSSIACLAISSGGMIW